MYVPKKIKMSRFSRESSLALLVHNPLTLSRVDQENDVRLLDEEQECPYDSGRSKIGSVTLGGGVNCLLRDVVPHDRSSKSNQDMIPLPLSAFAWLVGVGEFTAYFLCWAGRQCKCCPDISEHSYAPSLRYTDALCAVG